MNQSIEHAIRGLEPAETGDLREQIIGTVDRHPWWVFAAVATTIGLALLVSGQGLWFFFDEWRFIFDRHLTIDDLIRPHNEHWTAVLVLVYRGLVELVGTGSYVPFHATLIACHVFAASGVFALLGEIAPRGVALALTLLFLLYGAGSDNLLWAFQIGFVLSTGLGAWALAVAPRRPAISAALLTVAVATSGIGLFYLAATAALLIRTRAVVWLLIPASVYLAWFLISGSVADHPAPIGDRVASFAYGILASGGGLVAGGPAVGTLLAVLVAFAWRRGVLTVWSAVALVGLATGFFLIAWARAQLGPSLAGASRYVYVAAPFVMVIAAETWHAVGTRPSIRRLAPVLLGLAIVLNVAALAHARTLWDQRLAAEVFIPPHLRGIPAP